MTTPDPFSPNEASHYNTSDFSEPTFNQPPPPQPGYPAPGYGAYQQVPHHAPNPVDGVSIAAFVTGLLWTGPIAIILGAIGLKRTAAAIRSGRWMAWTGLILGIVGTISWIAVVAFVSWVSGVSTETENGSEGPGYFGSATEYGDDAYLDELWDNCDAGDMAACDTLYFDSPFGSDYEEFGNNCGTKGRPITQFFCDTSSDE